MIYAEVGSGFMQVGGDRPNGFIEMKGERPTLDHVALADGSWGIDSAAVERDKFKEDRVAAVSLIVVTTDSGMAFDGDEVSQGRMARAILVMQSKPDVSTVKWVLHDNTVVDVGLSELQEALALAGLRQTELWLQA